MGSRANLPLNFNRDKTERQLNARLEELLQKLKVNRPSEDPWLVRRAYDTAAERHRDQFRSSGEPYTTHLLEVAHILADMKLDATTLAAALLHDAIEDTEYPVSRLAERFGDEVARLVEGVTKIGRLNMMAPEARQAENVRKMLLAMVNDVRVVMVKLADRLHNMRTLEYLAPPKQQRIARETMDIYAPIAHRLGMALIKGEMEDLSFRYLEPDAYFALQKEVTEKAEQHKRFLEEVQNTIRTRLVENSIPAELEARVKGLYSLHRKIVKQERSLDQIYDLLAVRVITDTERNCYAALGVVHHIWKPVPGRFKDYIAIPKPNMYQSLHTTVVGPRAERIEIQIRTDEMHRVAEQGVAAHWRYKDGGRPDGKGPRKDGIRAGDAETYGWLRQLLEWQRELSDPTEFLETVKVDLFADEVFVFTPKGDVKSLPRGATPLDFAYAVHSEVGHKCVGAKVNGKIVPLRYRLKNGDTVEILTSPHSHPSKDWLTFVRTSRAQARIRQHIRQAEHKRSLEIGQEVAERELRRYGVSLAKAAKDGSLEKAAATLGYRTGDDVLVAVGYGKVDPDQLVKQLVPAEKLSEPSAEAPVTSRLTELFRRVARLPAGGVRISGIEDVLVRFGKCCNPLPGDPIVGFITRGRGVTVHTARCDKALAMDPQRRVDVSWDVKGDFKRLVAVKVVTDDKPGMLAKVSQTFSEAGINIAQANVRSSSDKAVLSFEVSVQDLKQLTGVMRNLERVEGVHSVERV